MLQSKSTLFLTASILLAALLAASGCSQKPAEQAVALTDPSSPAFLPGFFQLALGSVIDSPRITEVVRTGEGIGWHDHVRDVHEGCERFFRC